MSWAAVDPLDPLNVAYVGGVGKFRTLDSGEHWIPLRNRIIFTAASGSTAVAFGSDEFTEDRGETWQALGIHANALSKSEETGLLFAARGGGGVYSGHPEQWEYRGLSNQNIQSLAICEKQLLAVSVEGRIFRARIAASSIAPEGEMWLATGQLECNRWE